MSLSEHNRKIRNRGASGLIMNYLRSRAGQDVHVDEIMRAVNMPVDTVQKAIGYIRAKNLMDVEILARGVLWHVSAAGEPVVRPVADPKNNGSAKPEEQSNPDTRVGALFEVVHCTRAGAVIVESESGELYKVTQI